MNLWGSCRQRNKSLNTIPYFCCTICFLSCHLGSSCLFVVFSICHYLSLVCHLINYFVIDQLVQITQYSWIWLDKSHSVHANNPNHGWVTFHMGNTLLLSCLQVLVAGLDYNTLYWKDAVFFIGLKLSVVEDQKRKESWAPSNPLSGFKTICSHI